MLMNLPNVPCYTDQKGRPLANAPPIPVIDIHVQPWPPIGYAEDAALRSFVFGPPPSAQGITFHTGYGGPVTSTRPSPPTPTTGIYPPRTGLPTTPGIAVYTGNPAVSGHTSHGHNFSSTPGRASSFLDRNQNSLGDAEASSSSTTGAWSTIASSTILAHIQEVGYSTTVDNLVAMISTLRREAAAADWPIMAHKIRIAVVKAFDMTLAGSRDIRVSPKDLKAAAAGYPDPTWSEATFRALHIAGLLVELLKLGINSPGDVATAALQVFKRRHCGGYLPLMHSLLRAARNFLLPYSAVMELREKKDLLQSENELAQRILPMPSTIYVTRVGGKAISCIGYRSIVSRFSDQFHEGPVIH